MTRDEPLKQLLDRKVDLYNRPDFISSDPVSVPHGFSKKQDIEISAFFAATFAWGQRQTIIAKSLHLMHLMDRAPHDFILNHTPHDLKRFLDFRHRTFQPTDLLYFISFLRHHYRRHRSLELAFRTKSSEWNTGGALNQFRTYFFSLKHVPDRTRKHVASPDQKSACKRLNMFLRWMVRRDDRGVDFGLWKTIQPAKLVCPLDVHVGRVARRFGLLSRSQNDWKAAMELTNRLKSYNPDDPVRYDYALFGLGVIETEL